MKESAQAAAMVAAYRARAAERAGRFAEAVRRAVEAAEQQKVRAA